MAPLHALRFAIATAITLATLSAACAIAFVVAPDATIVFFNTFTHGVDLSRLVPPGGRPVTLAQVIGGMVALGAVGFVAGGTLAALYNAIGHDPSMQASRRSA